MMCTSGSSRATPRGLGARKCRLGKRRRVKPPFRSLTAPWHTRSACVRGPSFVRRHAEERDAVTGWIRAQPRGGANDWSFPWIEHVSMRPLALTQSKYVGSNQNSICSVKNYLLPYLSCHFKRTHIVLIWIGIMTASMQIRWSRSNTSIQNSNRQTFSQKVHSQETDGHGNKIIKQPWMQKEEHWHAAKNTSIVDRWQNHEVYRESQLVHGWTDEWVKYLDHISEIDISHHARYRQRLRSENTVYMRGVGSNKQAGPLCQRPGCESSATAFVSLQRAQGKGVPQIPMHLRTKQNSTLDPASPGLLVDLIPNTTGSPHQNSKGDGKGGADGGAN